MSLENLFLRESNAIEGEYRNEAFIDALNAWEYLKSLPMPFQNEAVKWTHYFLMERIRPAIAGKYRECDVEIGGAVKAFISVDLIQSDVKYQMMGITKSLENKDKLSIETKMNFAKAEHVKFEFIHPFEDGNGRVGRMFFNLHRLRFGLPILVINESDKGEYYDWFC
jgi:Fic family protein